jgi:hypothetical protein
MESALRTCLLAGAAVGAVSLPASIAEANGSVLTNDTASFRLVMFGDKGTQKSINAGNSVDIMRGSTGGSLGMNVNGSSEILLKWDEVDQPNKDPNLLVIEFWTKSRDDMMPFGVTHSGESFNFWTWNVGISNRVTFNGAQSVPLFTARVQLIRVDPNTGGQTTISNQSIMTGQDNPWQGKDGGTTQSLVGQGMNMVRLTYEIGVVPGPGSLALIGIAGACLTRRRR